MSVAPTIFATLTPENPKAKLAFSRICNRATCQHICVAARPEYDRDVSVHLFFEHRRSQEEKDDAASDSLTEPDDETEQQEGFKDLATIWKGCYTFNLHDPPITPGTGWAVGTGRVNQVDLIIDSVGSSDGIRGYHALFNFNLDTGFLCFLSRASSTVNGSHIVRGHTHALNQSRMRLSLGQLSYIFEYTEYARSDDFYLQRQAYLSNFSHGSDESFVLTPTPSGQARVIGQWTLGISLGKGSFGRVFAATNSKSELVAIKIIEWSKKRTQANDEIRVLEHLQNLSNYKDFEGRLVHLKDIIYQNGEGNYHSTAFQEIALVLEPACTRTFENLISNRNVKEFEKVNFFRDALQGVYFLHSHNWIHRDLKPANIGLSKSGATLLDFSDAVELQSRGFIEPTPGGHGTIGYLAPEYEIQNYNCLVDVWSIGIVGFQLFYGYHPWVLKENPWRDDKRHLQNDFNEMYRRAMDCIDSSTCLIGPLLKEMLAHPWAAQNKDRISVQNALGHSCFLNKQNEQKRMRRN
ncbi:MAG: hypothetical protein M1822_006858 [Bathelium mastoideum]|nr:MAG: hypothetical protein M1822_006858 [Bathelium mastoideum]